MTGATAGVLSTLFIHFVAITSQCISDKKAKVIVRGDGRERAKICIKYST